MSKLDWIIQHVPSDTKVIVRTEASPELGKGERVIGIKVGRCRAIVDAGEARDAQAVTERANIELFHSMFLK